jgi:hypothetical protein
MPDHPFFQHVYGWKITQGPPWPTSINESPPAPSAPVALGKTSNQTVPLQSLNLRERPPPPCANLKVVAPNDAYDSGQRGYRALNMSRSPIPYPLVALKLPAPTSVRVTIMAKAVSHSSDVEMTVNLTKKKPANARQRVHMHEFRPNVFVLTPDLLKEGENHLFFWNVGDGPTIVINEITAESDKIEIDGSYHWDKITGSLAYPGEPYSQENSIAWGVSQSKSQTLSFTEAVGAEVGAGLEGLSAKLNASFSATESVNSTIEFTESRTVQKILTIKCPEGAKAILGEWWQLVFEFKTSNGKTLTQRVPTSVADLQPTNFTVRDTSSG